MDQNWQTISLDRKETTAPLEKLHECLLSQKASLLVPLLAVPVIPHSHEHVEGVPGEKVEDEDDDLEYTKRRLKNGLLKIILARQLESNSTMKWTARVIVLKRSPFQAACHLGLIILSLGTWKPSKIPYSSA
ncbi:hypothetical protein N7510_001066 [Penicillium lagena]|uniref:uncharacterized protein n=1 Tax=Penicillium lagena TaxID=94218 RepID=UPI0025411079|nr:uncharacterized protein N7510_001066 [Penicillium lagena]KAJ5624757.1 hypothetical protein N7510_001066 [Penicillium lagena]